MSLNDFITLHLDLINLKNNKKKSKECLNKDCNIQAVFNYKNYLSINHITCRKNIYCSKHKLNSMVDIISKKCIVCYKKQPVFNYKGEKFALYCGDCKLNGMVDIKSKKCINCKIKHPAFNYKNEKKVLYCGDCKLTDMIDITNKKCIICNNKRPNFNYKDEKFALYCGDCKLENMIDIKHKKCIICNIKQPSCNYKNEKTTLYCGDCKLENMIEIKSKKCIDCNIKHPSYNYETELKSLYCKDCKLEDMIDIKNKKCKVNDCNTQVRNKQFKGYCLRCFIYNHPESKIIRDYGTREAKVTEFIKEEFSNLNITYNKQIQGGCSDHRPDIFIDCLTHSVIVEVDEHQHKRGDSYSTRCEIRRVNELFTSLADRPIIFIRFNPDDYEKDGRNISSCWGLDKKGLCVIKKSKQNEWKERLNVLEYHINYWINSENVTTKTIETIPLFYDNPDEI